MNLSPLSTSPLVNRPRKAITIQEKARSKILHQICVPSRHHPHMGDLVRLLHSCTRLRSNSVRSAPRYWVLLVHSIHMCASNRRSLVLGSRPTPTQYRMDQNNLPRPQVRQRQKISSVPAKAPCRPRCQISESRPLCPLSRKAFDLPFVTDFIDQLKVPRYFEMSS